MGWGHILDKGQCTSSYISVECVPHNLELPMAPQGGGYLMRSSLIKGGVLTGQPCAGGPA